MKRMIGFEIKTLDNMIMREILNQIKYEEILTPIQIRIMKYLYDNRDREIYQRDIERQMSIRRSTVSGIINTMEKNAMVRRIKSSSDLRVKRIVLTDKYVSRIDEIEKKLNSFNKKLLKNINSEDLNIFYSVVDQMKKNILESDINV